MKTPDLIQSSLFDRREFAVETDGISVQMKSLARAQQYHVQFENIPSKPEEFSVSSKRLLTAGILFSIFAVISFGIAVGGKEKDGWSIFLVWSVVAAAIWVWFLVTKKSLILYIQNGAGLVLLKDVPSAAAVEKFIKKLFLYRKEFLLKKYGRFADGESIESKLGRLDMLHSQGVLTEAEFEFRRRDLNSTGKTSGPIGFAPKHN